MLWVWDVNETGLALCPLVGFDDCAVQCTGFAPRVVLSYTLMCKKSGKPILMLYCRV